MEIKVQLSWQLMLNVFPKSLRNTWQLAHENVKESQVKIMSQYDKTHKAEHRKFSISDQVSVLLAVLGGSLQSRYERPYRVLERKFTSTMCLPLQTEERRLGWCMLTA